MDKHSRFAGFQLKLKNIEQKINRLNRRGMGTLEGGGTHKIISSLKKYETYVPMSQLQRYFFCSFVISSMQSPSDESFRLATCSSIS